MRRHREKPKATRLTTEQITYIGEKVQQEWSPEQISATMPSAGIQPVSHETIYRYLQKERSEGGTLYTHLRHKRRKYRKRYGSTDRRAQIKERVSIEERPAIVEERSRIGDFEIDTVIGKNHKQALVTIVDRYSKLTLIKKVTHKRAELVRTAAVELLLPISHWVHTITADNGKEFAEHAKISDALNAKVYFAHPYSSWERGTNENTNGLIRQYFPKRTSFEEITDEQIRIVQEKLNRRPKKPWGLERPMNSFLVKSTRV